MEWCGVRTGNVVDGGPLVLEDVQADAAIVVDVGVKHGRNEADLGRLVGVLLGELQLEPERATFPRRVVRSGQVSRNVSVVAITHF